jgi:hypothetical protein
VLCDAFVEFEQSKVQNLTQRLKQTLVRLKQALAKEAESGGGDGDAARTHELQIVADNLSNQIQNFQSLLTTHRTFKNVFRDYAGTYKGLRFKPSVIRKDKLLQPIATNLQIHTLRVRDPLHNRFFFYDIVTVGAFADHVAGFDHGGVPQQEEALKKHKAEMDKMLHEAHVVKDAVHLQRRIEKQLKVTELTAQLGRRLMVVVTQALSAIVTSVAATVLRHARDAVMLNSIAQCGLLVQVESLLSTFSREEFMLSDMIGAVDELAGRIAFRLLPDANLTYTAARIPFSILSPVDGCDGIRVTLAPESVLLHMHKPNANKESCPLIVELHLPVELYRTLPACIKYEDDASGSVLSARDVWNIENELFGQQGQGQQPEQAAAGGSAGSADAGGAEVIAGQVTSLLNAQNKLCDDDEKDELEMETHSSQHLTFQKGGGGGGKGGGDNSNGSAAAGAEAAAGASPRQLPAYKIRTVQVVPILTSQGVNEMQSFAQKLGKVETQRVHNIRAIEQLERYGARFVAHALGHVLPKTGDHSHHQHPKQQQSSHEKKLESMLGSASSKEKAIADTRRYLSDLQQMVNQGDVGKNIKFLRIVSQLVRVMHGGRIVCCKSAKDRTSMSVTLEQARILESHGVAEDQFNQVLDLTRAYGVRRANVLNNTGKLWYAFNAIQRTMLPTMFVPPAYSCGHTES